MSERWRPSPQGTLDQLLNSIEQQLNYTDHLIVTSTFLHTFDSDERDERTDFISAAMAIKDGRRPDFSYLESIKEKWEKGLKERQLVAEYWPASATYRVRRQTKG